MLAASHAACSMCPSSLEHTAKGQAQGNGGIGSRSRKRRTRRRTRRRYKGGSQKTKQKTQDQKNAVAARRYNSQPRWRLSLGQAWAGLLALEPLSALWGWAKSYRCASTRHDARNDLASDGAAAVAAAPLGAQTARRGRGRVAGGNCAVGAVIGWNANGPRSVS